MVRPTRNDNRRCKLQEGVNSMIGNYRIIFLCLILALSCWMTGRLDAHCDGMVGPVVKAAQQALTAGNANAVLIWVQKKDEGEVKRALEQTLAVRKLSPEAAGLADRYFFETVVRLHRAGEGEPYSGLKPAGRDLGPAIPAAERALESGSVVCSGRGRRERSRNELAI